MERTLNDLEQKLKVIENNLAEEIAPKVNELFKDSIRYSLVDWYNDYDQNMYKRTNNFMNVLDTAETSGKGNLLTMSLSSGSMNSYKGFDIPPYEGYERKTLDSDTAYDYMWNDGEHGHGKWMKHKSMPPHQYVDRDTRDGFGGQLDKIVNSKIDEILRK